MSTFSASVPRNEHCALLQNEGRRSRFAQPRGVNRVPIGAGAGVLPVALCGGGRLGLALDMMRMGGRGGQ